MDELNHPAQLERIDPSQPLAARFVKKVSARPLAARFVEKFRLDGEGARKRLRDRDVVTLLPISPQFANAVTLKGHLAQALRSPHPPGLRVRDLIPGPEAFDFVRFPPAQEPDGTVAHSNDNRSWFDYGGLRPHRI